MVAHPPQYLSSLSCELRIIKAKNIEFNKSISKGGLFVRYYLSAGNNKRIQLNTKEISPSSGNLIWNESFSLECLGSEDSISNLKQQSVVFELRWRRTTPSFLGKKCKSQLLGRAEISWEKVLESPKMEIENWVVMPSKQSNNTRVYNEDVKPPSVQVAMKVEVPKLVEMKRNERLKKRGHHEECGCGDGGAFHCVDYELFALVGALEAL
ncbi:uncharacterized protein LOC116127041 [Pistacia vera]|uniref:uncharacterized protein LOC116126996 n=1 Tax=Pistacia vera TaxID=55513 RepID=UPI0012633645|nr:uncharacterized protein LOC116126996 [Pistacia vera]XP_031268573.1 uncharacterized protein LOC116127041 [Pistacia vera]